MWRGAAVCILAAVAALVVVHWEEFLEAGTFHRPLNYDGPFGPAIAAADRIVVRADGFDCCGPVDESGVLF